MLCEDRFSIISVFLAEKCAFLIEYIHTVNYSNIVRTMHCIIVELHDKLYVH